MRELSIKMTEQAKGGCSSDEAFAYGAAAGYYGRKSSQNPGNDFYFGMWLFYTNKLFSCI